MMDLKRCDLHLSRTNKYLSSIIKILLNRKYYSKIRNDHSNRHLSSKQPIIKIKIKITQNLRYIIIRNITNDH